MGEVKVDIEDDSNKKLKQSSSIEKKKEVVSTQPKTAITANTTKAIQNSKIENSYNPIKVESTSELPQPISNTSKELMKKKKRGRGRGSICERNMSMLLDKKQTTNKGTNSIVGSNKNINAGNKLSVATETFENYENNNNTEIPNFLDSTLECIDHKPGYEESQTIIESLKNTLPSNPGEEILNLLLTELHYFKYKKGKIIYEQGDEGDYLYILAAGKVQGISTNEKEEKKEKIYSDWDVFGELAYLRSCVREETLTCQTDVSFYTLDCERFRETQTRVSEAQLKERYNLVNSVPLFEPLGNISKHCLCKLIKPKEFKPNEKIIIMGTVGETLYIIKEGLVSCRIGMQEIRKLENGEFFGQNAILMDIKRGCDVVSITKTICYEISRSDLKEAIPNDDYIGEILFSLFQNFVNKNQFFKDSFPESMLYEVFKAFSVQRYSKFNPIYSPNFKTNRRVIVVIEGGLFKEKPNINKDPTQKNINIEDDYDSFASKGDIIGENLFTTLSSYLPSDVIAYPDCITMEADCEQICKILNIVLEDSKSSGLLKLEKEEKEEKENKEVEKEGAIPFNVAHRSAKLKKVFLFKNLSDHTLGKLAVAMKKKKYEKDKPIVEEGTAGDSFYLISKGRVRITIKGEMLRDMDAGNCFGEIALLREGELRTATVTALEETVCYVIKKSEFDVVLSDKNIKEILMKKIALQDTSIELKDLYNIKFLGKGKFGCVNLVHNGKNIYAIKAVSKKSVENQKILAKYYVNERRVMLSLDHPFIVKMVKTLQNNKFCFYLLEWINGENMDEYISSNRHAKHNLEEAKFYIAIMILVLEYLQKKNIVHRDIKPSNIMISGNGYLKMIDFGTAKVLTNYTHTVIGTPFYIAPEILQGKGYSSSCDYWSIGICLYEMFYGTYPFGGTATEVIEIYKEILNKDYFTPVGKDFDNVNGLIADLLHKKPNSRLCNAYILKKRPLFKGFDWDKLIDFQLEAPYKPETKDTSQMLKCKDPFENCIKESDFMISEKSGKTPHGYNKKWADEF
ncbi:MAG: cyclic nucleotide-binding serine/threonine-protein kinase [archaeon]|nr:cyclic nucleotide-binding serine/threonine-protein kinase [archaeon]